MPAFSMDDAACSSSAVLVEQDAAALMIPTCNEGPDDRGKPGRQIWRAPPPDAMLAPSNSRVPAR
jgi:hypothetical protein